MEKDKYVEEKKNTNSKHIELKKENDFQKIVQTILRQNFLQKRLYLLF